MTSLTDNMRWIEAESRALCDLAVGLVAAIQGTHC